MTRTIAPRPRTLVLLFLAVAGALLAGAAPASAHAAVTGSNPAQGTVVQQAPARVSLTFSEKVAMNDDSLHVLDPKGDKVDTGKPSNVSGTTYAVPLRGGLADGTYTVTYQVVSADSHPVSGAYTFSIGAPSRTSVSVSGPAVGGGVVGALYGFGRYVSYAGFIVLVGGAAFVLACWQRGSGVRALQRLVVGGWLALTAATLWLLLLRGSYTGSGKVGDIFDLGLLGEVLQTKTGAALVSRLLLLAAAALFIAVLFGAFARPADDAGADAGTGADGGAETDGGERASDGGIAAGGRDDGARDDERQDDERRDKEKRDLAFGLATGGTVVAAGLAASWAMAEHASTGLQPGIAMPVDVLHLLAVATWLGGLVALLTALYRAPAETPVTTGAARRFSRIAFGSVLVLVATGIYQSWRQLGSWSAFTDTGYGQLLLVKIALVAVMIAIAFLSRRWTARLAEAAVGTPGPKQREREKEPVPAPAAAPGDTKRATQLARQRAAVDAARQKRLRDADPVRSGLRRSVLAEAGVAVVVLAVTTVLTQTEPGRTEQEAAAATSSSSSSSASSSSGAVTLDMPFDTGGADGKGVVRLDLDPARVGANELHLYVTEPDGRPRDVPEVRLAFTLTAKKIGPLPVTPERITTGHWAASGLQIPMAGEWKIAVTVRTSDIDQTTVSKNAQIG